MTGKHQDQKNNYQFLKLLFEELDLPGLQELMTAEKVENLFNRLFEEQGLQLVKAEQTFAGNTKPSFGTCPYCQSSIHEGETKVYCAECSIPHHEDCWLENGRCALFGCTGRQTQAEPGAYGAKKEQMVLELSELPPEDEFRAYDLNKEWEKIREGMPPMELPVVESRERDEESITDRLFTIIWYSAAAGIAILVLALLFSAL